MDVNKKCIVSIEGNIGSGKSTLVEKLRQHIMQKNATFLDEPVDEWMTITDDKGEHILSKFYANQEKYAFPFQMMAYISRLNKLKEALKKEDSIIFTERSLSTDKYVFAQMLHDSNKIDTFEYQIYNKWFDTFNKETLVTHIIYVKTNPTICHERVGKRSRIGESNISEEYLLSCHEYHENMIQSLKEKGIPVLVIDGNDNVFDEIVLKTWLNNIYTFVTEQEPENKIDCNISTRT